MLLNSGRNKKNLAEKISRNINFNTFGTFSIYSRGRPTLRIRNLRYNIVLEITYTQQVTRFQWSCAAIVLIKQLVFVYCLIILLRNCFKKQKFYQSRHLVISVRKFQRKFQRFPTMLEDEQPIHFKYTPTLRFPTKQNKTLFHFQKKKNIKGRQIRTSDFN